MALTGHVRGVGPWPARVLGLVFVLIGLVLAIGGAWLLALGGSFYYLPAGLGLIVSGVLLWRASRLGFWVYVAVFAATLVWALWEVGLDGWGLLPRLFAPMVLLLLAILVLPTLDRVRGRRQMVFGLAAFAVLAVAGGATIAVANRAAPALALGPQRPGPMSEPSLLQTGADWPAYGGTYSARRYSPLGQITPGNVNQLQRAWVYHTGDLPKEKWGAETTPLKIGDTVYLCSARNIIIALDAATGKERWRHDPKVSDAWIPYTTACRGVAYYATASAPGEPAGPCAARIIEGTLDGRLIAVDARTGAACADFGQNGQVDIKVGMGPVYPGMVSITAAPTIVRGVVVTGHEVLDGESNTAPSGVIQGYDAITGALRWAWDMTRPDITAAPPSGETYTRGTPNMWTGATGDEALGLVYLPLGNSASDYYSSDRSAAENQYSSSLVALDVTTGKPVWSFQTVHKDVWDYDLGSQATLIDFPTTGGVAPAILLPSKQGDLYVLDRRTGVPLTRVEERPVPQGGVEPAARSRTQPFSLYHTLRGPDLTEKSMWGMSPIDQMICRINFRRAHYDGFYTPPTADAHSIEYPSYNGGSDWGGVAVDPIRGLIIANYNDMPNYNLLVTRAEADKKGWFARGDPRAKKGAAAEGAGSPQAGVPYAVDVNAGWRMKFTKLMCKAPPYGGIRAIDLATGHTVWDRPLGTARKNGPFGEPSMLPLNIGTPNNGGSVVTAGGLIFIAAATDDLIRAIDITTAKTVWTDKLPAGGQATPMVYEENGRQYLVLMTGGHHFMETPEGDQVIAWALPQK